VAQSGGEHLVGAHARQGLSAAVHQWQGRVGTRRASALGEFFERLGCHYFWTHFYLGQTRAERPFVHYPQERWFAPTDDGAWPAELLNP
jgi:ribosomal protein S12 methylthiotransferase accessory factor YcaO